jgi:disulfide bond formation protein DsbB
MQSLLPDTRFKSLLVIAVVALATIAGAWIFQAYGIVPCELCLKQRFAYYAAVPLATLLTALQARRGGSVVTIGLAGLALIFAANAVLGIYHSGVEAMLWAGPEACTGAVKGSPNVADLLKEIQTIKIVRCDEVQLRLLGLTLANWNVLISLALAALAVRAVRQPGQELDRRLAQRQAVDTHGAVSR